MVFFYYYYYGFVVKVFVFSCREFRHTSTTLDNLYFDNFATLKRILE